MIRRARVIAIDGAHGTGKTTLVHALASRLKERNTHIGVLGDAARSSCLVEDVAVHGSGKPDLVTELHVLATQLAGEQAMARHHEMIICDKSLLSVLAYTRLFLGDEVVGEETALFDAMTAFLHSYAPRYDAIYLLGDLYDLGRTADPYRPIDPELRASAAALIHAECEAAGANTHEVPRGLPTTEKVDWVLARCP